MSRVSRFLTNTPFARYAATAVFVLLVGYQAAVWGKRQVLEVLAPRVEAYLVERLMPRVLDQARQAVAKGIREGANGAASDLTGGWLGTAPHSGALTGKREAPSFGASDPCRVPEFRLPGFPQRLSQ